MTPYDFALNKHIPIKFVRDLVKYAPSYVRKEMRYRMLVHDEETMFAVVAQQDTS